jgi:hypothetical protein
MTLAISGQPHLLSHNIQQLMNARAIADRSSHYRWNGKGQRTSAEIDGALSRGAPPVPEQV